MPQGVSQISNDDAFVTDKEASGIDEVDYDVTAMMNGMRVDDQMEEHLGDDGDTTVDIPQLALPLEVSTLHIYTREN